MKTAIVALALVALLAAASVAPAQAAFCHTSSYAVDCATVLTKKTAMFGACGAKVTVTAQTKVGNCCVFVQKVESQAAWDAFSKCEKDDKNSGNYGPLKSASAACAAFKKSGTC